MRCPNWDAGVNCDCTYCHARTLLALSTKLLDVPVTYGVDQSDYDDLRHIAGQMCLAAVMDHGRCETRKLPVIADCREPSLEDLERRFDAAKHRTKLPPTGPR